MRRYVPILILPALLAGPVASERVDAAKGRQAEQPGWRPHVADARRDHQVALLTRRHRRLALAIITQFDPSHRYRKRTLRGVAARLLAGLGRDR